MIKENNISEISPEKIILIGGGGNASSIASIFTNKIAGYISPQPSSIMGRLPWLGEDRDISDYIKRGFRFNMAFIYSGKPEMSKRANLINEYKKRGAIFSSLISKNAVITPFSKIGSGTTVMNGALLNKVEVDTNCMINTGAIIEHDCKIGTNSFIGPGAVIGGFVKIGGNCFIGLGARIRNNIIIGDNVIVGMGSIVTKNIEEPGIYYGII